jgi:acetylornithine deacetylase/succinyl-diaminopimelate desuccinylase-like protein
MAGPLEAIRKLNGKPDARWQRALNELASAQGVRQCFQHFHRNRQWTNEQHLQLCRVPAPTFFEEKRAEWMAAQFKTLGWEAKIDRAGNVVAYPDGNREGPFVALSAHLDTVLSPRHIEDVRIGPDGRFHGPGVSDNGAGLAALLAIASCWKERPVTVENGSSLILVANVGEEGEGNLSGMRFLCRQSPLANRIRSYLVLDGPGTEHITCKALASRRFEVIVQGPGGHSWSDHGNANPVHTLSRAIHLFTEAQFESGPGAARSSYNFGMIEGGVSVNSIPSSARAKLDLRSEDAERIEDLARGLTAAVERAIEVENERSAGGRVQGKIREIGARPGGRLAEDARILPYLRAVDAHLGIRSHMDCASTDANIPLSMGLEAVSIGAGGSGGGAHTPEEWYDPEGRELGLQRVLLTLCLLLSA